MDADTPAHRRGTLRVRRVALVGAGLLPILLQPLSAAASLVDLLGQYANDVESSAAIANQATYESLLTDNGGPCGARQRLGAGECGGQLFEVFASTRELVHSANELTGQGPTEFGLGVDLSGLGTALRWTAGEEFSAQQSLGNEFVSSQLSGLAGRLSALRGGATGFFLSGFPAHEGAYASSDSGAPQGLGASADTQPQISETYTPWGGFLNGSYGVGDREATGNEDAFDFDGFELTLGVDYRFDSQWVAGVLGGYTEREVDFEPVNEVVVDGGITSDGLSLMVFGLYYSDAWYVSLAAGYQTMDFDTDRAIKYPSLNPDVASVNTRTLSSTSSRTWTGNATVGYNFRLGDAIGIEPYARLDFADTRVDGFTERDVNGEGFELQVGDQDIPSVETIAGLRLQYTATPSFAVLTPFLTAEYHHQFEDAPRRIDAIYRRARDQLDTREARFRVATDAQDSQYLVFSAGVSTVLRGGQQRADNGEISGGIQAFIAYRSVQGLRYYSHDLISAGLRYEF